MGDRPPLSSMHDWLNEQVREHEEVTKTFDVGSTMNAYHRGWIDALQTVRRRVCP